MSAAIYPLAPGTQYGPCLEPCLHSDCQRSRTDSAMECRICKQPIGYGNRTYREGDGTTYNLVHADCLENEAEIAKTTFKVGDRVEVDTVESVGSQTAPRWKLGRIVASGGFSGNQFWSVHLDIHTDPHLTISIPKGNAAAQLRHSDTPLPDRGMPLSDRQTRSGRFEVSHVCECGHSRYQHNHNGSGECMAKVWIEGQFDSSRCDCRKFSDRSFAGDPDPVNPIMPPTPEHLVPIIDTMKGFKVGDLLERTEFGVLNQYEVQSIAGEMVTYQRIVPNTEQTATVPVAWLAAKIMRGEVIYRPLDTRTKGNQLPKSVTPYEPKFGDMFWAGEEVVKIISVNSEQVLLERQQGVPIKYSIAFLRSSLANGSWKFVDTRDQIDFLTKQADRLDEVAANAVEQRARIVEQINALKATQG